MWCKKVEKENQSVKSKKEKNSTNLCEVKKKKRKQFKPICVKYCFPSPFHTAGPPLSPWCDTFTISEKGKIFLLETPESKELPPDKRRSCRQSTRHRTCCWWSRTLCSWEREQCNLNDFSWSTWPYFVSCLHFVCDIIGTDTSWRLRGQKMPLLSRLSYLVGHNTSILDLLW